MTRLPVISGREAIRGLEKAGMKTTLSIPEHKTLDRGLLRSLIRDAYLSVDEFKELLKR